MADDDVNRVAKRFAPSPGRGHCVRMRTAARTLRRAGGGEANYWAAARRVAAATSIGVRSESASSAGLMALPPGDPMAICTA